MLLFLGILTVIACILLGIFVLVQNPKGGGLSATFGGFSNQVMGVRQTTDVLEKGTWTLAIVIGALCLLSAFFLPKATNLPQANPTEQQQQPAQQNPSSTPINLPGE